MGKLGCYQVTRVGNQTRLAVTIHRLALGLVEGHSSVGVKGRLFQQSDDDTERMA